MQTDIRLFGFSELDRKLHELPEKLGRSILRKAAVAGAKVIQEEANRHVVSSHTKKPIILKVSQKWSTVTVKIGVSIKRWYLKFFEKGTDLRYTKKGANRGKLAARPFLLPAIESKKHEAIEKIGEVLGKEIEAASRI